MLKQSVLSTIHLTINNVAANYSQKNPVFNQSLEMQMFAEKIRCIVLVQNRIGRLGNRMFLVASGYGLARLHHCHLYIPPDIINELQETFVFNLSSLLISSDMFEFLVNHTSKILKRVTKATICEYFSELMRPNAIPRGTLYEVAEYWQSYLHFAKYENELRERIFIGNSLVLEKVSKFFIDIYQRKFNTTLQLPTDNHHSLKTQLRQLNSITWIAIHFRLGDFVRFRFISTRSYLFSSIDYFTSLYPNAHFIVSSDNKSYCEDLFRNRLNIFLTPTSYSSGDDLITLSLCQHSIITAGTFGWWTAYLANGQVIHDRMYISGCARREQYYPRRFMISGNVRESKRK